MASADKLMYEQKQNKKVLLPQGASLTNKRYSVTNMVAENAVIYCES